jgi:hypothetical protein
MAKDSNSDVMGENFKFVVAVLARRGKTNSDEYSMTVLAHLIVCDDASWVNMNSVTTRAKRKREY